MSRSWFTACCCLILALNFAGCVRTAQFLILNPDGSGKMNLHTVINPDDIPFMESSDDDELEELRVGTMKDVIEDSEGIEAWKDLKAEVDGKGKLVVTATAYFRDINKVDLDGLISGVPVFLSKNDDGDMVVIMERGSKDDDDKDEDEEAIDPSTLTEEEIEDLVAEKKKKAKFAASMMGMMLSDFHLNMSIRVPEPVKESQILKRAADGSYAMEFDGAEFASIMTDLVNDDEFWRREIMAGRSGNVTNNSEIQKRMYGAEGPAKLVFSAAAAPLFDYEAEVSEARASEDKVREELGIPRD